MTTNCLNFHEYYNLDSIKKLIKIKENNKKLAFLINQFGIIASKQTIKKIMTTPLM